MTTIKKPIFIGFLGLLHFFFSFFCFYFSNIEKEKQKMQFSFRKPHFWHPPNFAKTLFWHIVALFVFPKMPKKHCKTGEKQWKKNLDKFLTLNLDQFFTLKPPNLGPVYNFTAYIYSCGVIIWAKFGLLRCYYLGQVCHKTLSNRGFSTFFWKKNCARTFEVLLFGPSWSFLRCSQLGPDNNTYLAQIITPQNAYFFVFFAFKNLLKYLFL